ncbi:T9SS type A sorting domain-containing protein [Flaviaesturariibacter aridisoli]|uniref:T9SS type A sorting domain-containing protein n=1 Tax=Flaviaesturariibacter aridisoli TaxID=2545761 RepID=A0A4R4DQI7_9BACT|nr:T9SS type A sorting domain-containing protein [Flaviaesturariibacter aridisoli]TCZ63400.1 T9SS type A sorting domain-containing protein [Flaviaesturariibacter aridisoli]
MRKMVLFLALLVSSASAFAFGGSFISPTQYRWRNDDGNEATATWRAPEGTPLSLSNAAGQTLRLRMSYDVSGPETKDTVVAAGLQYMADGSGVWISVTNNTSNDFVIATSPNVTGGTPTTDQLSGTVPHMGGYVGDGSGPAVISFHVDQAMTTTYEMEWVLQPTIHAHTSQYLFRMAGERPFIVAMPAYAVLDYTVPAFTYSGSPYCGTSGSATITNSYPAGGVYSGDAGLSIDPVTGDVDLAASTAGLHTASYTYSGGTLNTQIAVRPQIAMPTGMNNVPNQSLCSGSPTNPVTFSSPIQGLTYNWTNSNPNIGFVASGSGDLPSFVAGNAGPAIEYAQFNVKPSGGTGCTFRNMAFRIAVNPVPEANPVADQFYCTGTAVAPMSFSSATPGTYFAWTSSNAAIGLSQRKGTNTIPAFTASNTVGVTSTIAVTPIANHCVGTPMTFQVQTQNCTAGSTGTGDADARIAFDRSVIAGPNPSTGVVRVQYSGTAQQLDVLVRDAYGTILMPVRRVASTNIQVDLSALRPGSYSIQFADPRTGTSIVRTIVKL